MKYQFNAKNVLITPLGDEGVAFNNETNAYFSLNETSFKILKGIESGLSVEQICAQLQNEYDIEPAECEREVKNTIGVLVTQKLVIEK